MKDILFKLFLCSFFVFSLSLVSYSQIETLGHQKLLLSAQEGDAWAQYNLARTYYDGQGVLQNYEKALKWYLKSAEQGNSWAQRSLGKIYEGGHGILENHQEAIKWYLKSAEQNFSMAQWDLGNMYRMGKGVVQNYQEAFKWYLKAAEQGFAGAQFDLGQMYFEGKGVLRDNVLACMWFSLSVSNSSGSIRKSRGNTRDKLTQMMTQKQIIETQDLVRSFKSK